MDVSPEEMQRRADSILAQITPEEEERVRNLLNTPVEITLDTNACDIEAIQLLAVDTDMTPRELASKLFEKAVHDFVSYAANMKLMSMGDLGDIHS